MILGRAKKTFRLCKEAGGLEKQIAYNYAEWYTFFMFKPIAKLLKALSSNRDPGAIACAFACGIVLGVMPKDNALWYILFIFIFFMRIQRGAFTLAVIGFLKITSTKTSSRIEVSFILISSKGIPLMINEELSIEGEKFSSPV